MKDVDNRERFTIQQKFPVHSSDFDKNMTLKYSPPGKVKYIKLVRKLTHADIANQLFVSDLKH